MEITAAFMRAAYGKGYCDALTEDDAGSLCLDHGYRLPAKRDAQRSCDLWSKPRARIARWRESAVPRGSWSPSPSQRL